MHKKDLFIYLFIYLFQVHLCYIHSSISSLFIIKGQLDTNTAA